MTGRGTLYALLAVVAGAAGMLSFAALRDLAQLCGFAPVLAWLLPVVVDAGAAAGSLGWLADRTGQRARRFARRLALGLLGLSVAANALGHGLAAYTLAPPWWVVVALSGIAPAVLGAMVHLAVLVGQPDAQVSPAVGSAGSDDEPAGPMEPGDDAGDEHDARDGRGISHRWATGPTATPALTPALPPAAVPVAPAAPADRAAVLIAAGAGRRRLSRDLGITEYEARQLLAGAREGSAPTAAPASPTAPSTTSSTSSTSTGVPV